GTMPVDERNIQPWGILNGGAALALAETTAGLGSVALCPGHIVSGICIDGHHVHSAFKGDTLTATARILHRGHHTHIWDVDIKNGNGELISHVNVTNYISAPISKN
ncbi:MAG: PaaI family thioesterase, partial [Alistipes sp.]|nr:PaaI family thioesterase [Candidatus Minthomonas equi]